MGRMYSASFEKVAVSAAQDLFEIVAPADSVVVLHSLHLGQSSDAGDAMAEMLNILITRATGSGSGGSSPTPTPLNKGDAAFGGTVEANNTTPGAEGVFVHACTFNVQGGLDVVWTPETRPVISPSERICVNLQDAPADALTMNGTLYFEEIGG